MIHLRHKIRLYSKLFGSVDVRCGTAKHSKIQPLRNLRKQGLVLPPIKYRHVIYMTPGKRPRSGWPLAPAREEVQLYAFDILALDGEGLRSLPLSMRKITLALAGPQGGKVGRRRFERAWSG